MSSNLDAGLVYRPPNSLQFPKGMEPKPKQESRAGSPNSSSSSQSDLSFSPTLKRDGQFDFPVKSSPEDGSIEKDEELAIVAGVSLENESDSTSTGNTILKLHDSSSSTEGDKRNSPGRFPKTPVSLHICLFFKLVVYFH